jgi:hypothetical protein
VSFSNRQIRLYANSHPSRPGTSTGPQSSPPLASQTAAGADGNVTPTRKSRTTAGKRNNEEVEASDDIPLPPVKQPRNRRGNKADV